MGENEVPSSTPSRPAPADRVLLELADTLDFAGIQLRYPDWSRDQLCALLETAAVHLRPDERPTVIQRLGALLPICAIFIAGRVLLLFGRYMEGMVAELDARAPAITRWALQAAEWDPGPVWVLTGALLAVCLAWAWFSRKRLRRFTCWVSIVGTLLGLGYLLACLWPLLGLWPHGGLRFM